MIWNFSILCREGIQFSEMPKAEAEAFNVEWFNRVVPIDEQESIVDLCFSSDFVFGYLWHVFSYEVVKCKTGPHAREALDRAPKRAAVLFSSLAGEAVRISDASAITPSILDSMDDVVLTSADFQWTYAKTHEPDIGPFFHVITQVCENTDKQEAQS